MPCANMLWLNFCFGLKRPCRLSIAERANQVMTQRRLRQTNWAKAGVPKTLVKMKTLPTFTVFPSEHTCVEFEPGYWTTCPHNMMDTETKLLRAIVYVMYIIISNFIITLETMTSLLCYRKEIKFNLFYKNDL